MVSEIHSSEIKIMQFTSSLHQHFNKILLDVLLEWLTVLLEYFDVKCLLLLHIISRVNNGRESIQLPYTASKMSSQVEKPFCSAFKGSVE